MLINELGPKQGSITVRSVGSTQRTYKADKFMSMQQQRYHQQRRPSWQQARDVRQSESDSGEWKDDNEVVVLDDDDDEYGDDHHERTRTSSLKDILCSRRGSDSGADAVDGVVVRAMKASGRATILAAGSTTKKGIKSGVATMRRRSGMANSSLSSSERAFDNADSVVKNVSQNRNDQHNKHKDVKRRVSKRQQMQQLPLGWKSIVDPNSGMMYYYHTESGKTSWAKPIMATDNVLVSPEKRGERPVWSKLDRNVSTDSPTGVADEILSFPEDKFSISSNSFNNNNLLDEEDLIITASESCNDTVAIRLVDDGEADTLAAANHDRQRFVKSSNNDVELELIENRSNHNHHLELIENNESTVHELKSRAESELDAQVGFDVNEENVDRLFEKVEQILYNKKNYQKNSCSQHQRQEGGGDTSRTLDEAIQLLDLIMSKRESSQHSTGKDDEEDVADISSQCRRIQQKVESKQLFNNNQDDIEHEDDVTCEDSTALSSADVKDIGCTAAVRKTITAMFEDNIIDVFGDAINEVLTRNNDHYDDDDDESYYDSEVSYSSEEEEEKTRRLKKKYRDSKKNKNSRRRNNVRSHHKKRRHGKKKKSQSSSSIRKNHHASELPRSVYSPAKVVSGSGDGGTDTQRRSYSVSFEPNTILKELDELEKKESKK